MERISQHPIRSKIDALTRALVMEGFALHDDCGTSEIVDADWLFSLAEQTGFDRKLPILLEEEGRYALRTNLLAAQLADMAGAAQPRVFAVGRVYDGADDAVPARWVVEGVAVEGGFIARAWERTWTRIAQAVYGLGAQARLRPLDGCAYEVACAEGGGELVFARMAKASRIARTLLGVAGEGDDAWVFSIDVDGLALRDAGCPDRAALYSPRVSFLDRFADDKPAAGGAFLHRAADVMRTRGYREFFGIGLYEQDAYRKMNMIMEAWDLNNRGALLQKPFGPFTRVPTVLTPSLQDALEANFEAGEQEVRIFEVAHHYVLEKIGAEPVLKTSLSFGAYGPGIDRAGFRADVDAVLSELGIANHFFIPTDMAIPYDPADCWVLLDERMQYLGGNFGSICQKALDAHGIGVPAYMAQLELQPLERKAEEELRFVAPETLR